jgi:AcrR family transcriptional regulator
MAERRSGGLGVTRSIAPMYQRLPRGPHHLGPEEVARNQRLRMYGAVVEAVARDGYADTSVKQIIGLAGVSRRAFYEQFANKQECFLATFDLIAARAVKRINEAYLASDGDLAQRMGVAVAEFTDEIQSNVKGASLAIVHAQTAGAGGLARVRRATCTVEQMLANSFAHAPEAGPLPAPILRGIVGGVHEVASLRLRTGRSEEIAAMNEEIVRWTLLFHTPIIGRLSERLSEHLSRGARASSIAAAHAQLAGDVNGHRNGADSALDGWMPAGIRAVSPTRAHLNGAALDSEEDLRERLCMSVLNLAVVDDYHELTVPQIAEEAGVPMECFLDLFASKEECFLAAFDQIGDELLRTAADPDLISRDWPGAVCRVLGELLSILAARPLYAHVIACEAPSACPEALARDCDLAHDIAALLTEGAPGPARCELAVEGVAGAIWHTIRCQVASGQIHLLPALSDYLAYIVLAPFLGAEEAATIVIGEQTELAA